MATQSTHRMPAISSSTKNTLYQLASAEPQCTTTYQLKPACANKGSETIDPAMAAADVARVRIADHGGAGGKARILET
jgi:hypothetical protein